MRISSANAAGDPNKLLDAVIEKLNLKNDAALSRQLEVGTSVISKIRHGRLPVSASLLIRVHEDTGFGINELRLLLGDQEEGKKFARPGSKGRAIRSPAPRRNTKAVMRNKSLPVWTDGLEVQIAKVLVWKGFESKREVQATLGRGESIDRIGPTRLVRLQKWLQA
jgi:hypothetical protein